MADLSVTATNVIPQSGATLVNGTAGSATIAAGSPVYRNTTDGDYELAASTSAVVANVAGLAVNTTGNGQPMALIAAGDVAMGSILTVGTLYYVSGTGSIQPAADLASTEFVTLLGVAISTSVLRLNIIASGVQVP